jgi:hypothetical protein
MSDISMFLFEGLHILKKYPLLKFVLIFKT